MSDKNKLVCPECGGAMAVVRVSQDQTRPEYEKQKLECVACGDVAFRTVDATGRPVR